MNAPASGTAPTRRHRISLTTRLVLTLVTLLGVVAVAIAALAAVGLRSYLVGELDDRVERTASTLFDANRPSGPPGRDGRSAGTLVATDQGGTIRGFGLEPVITLTEAQTRRVMAAADPQGATVTVGSHGPYRVHSYRTGLGATVVVGLPASDVNDTVQNLLLRELLLTLVGLVVAGGTGWLLVRRQLAPLREVAGTAHRVAATPMSSGEVAGIDRVPARLIGSSPEVGRVGDALNTLLDHVEQALRDRHASEQQVRQFVADASHELRTPLATVRGYAELARRNPEDPAAARTAVDKVEQEAARMGALVEDLLLLARLDQGRPLAEEPVDLREIAVEVVSDARVIAPDHHWQLDLGLELGDEEGDEEMPSGGEVTGDPARLHQVVSNLVTNAWRHTPPGTTVRVGVATDPTGTTLSVSDTGPGIDLDLLPRVFERFTRGDRARTRGRGDSSHGTGLGLSMVRAIATAHGGTVSATSDDSGTRIVVRLPAAPPPPDRTGTER